MQSSQARHPCRYAMYGLAVLTAVLIVALRGAGEAGAADPGAKPAAQGTVATAGVEVKTATVPGLGRVLVDFRGRTLYVFHGDNPPLYWFHLDPSPSCYGSCSEFWPPLLANGAPKGTPDIQAALGTVPREDGTTQVTYEGRPLYECSEDTEADEANGDEAEMFDDAWYAGRPSRPGA